MRSGVSHAVAALLTAIPVIGMGVFAPPAAPLAARVGATRAVAIALALIAGGGLARSVAPGAAAVIALTIPIGIGMGLGNALMVVAVKERFADRPLLVTGVYACSIQLGAALATLLAVPLADAGDSWRVPMFVFSAAAACSLAWWLVSTRGAPPSPVGRRARFPLRSPIAWLFVALFVTSAFVYYGLSAWLPDAFTERGWSDGHAGELVFAINLFAIPSGLTSRSIGDRFAWSRRTLLLPPGRLPGRRRDDDRARSGPRAGLGVHPRHRQRGDLPAHDDAAARRRRSARAGRGPGRDDARDRLHGRARSRRC